MPKPRLVILISGGGTNLQAFIDACNNGDLDASIAVVISNRPGVYGLERAKQANIETQVLDHTLYASREAFDLALADTIKQYQPDAVILAGFMRILTPGFVSQFHGKLLNIHPSLLPKYPGLHTHQRAIDAGDQEAGATVHFVTEELDGGPPVLQVRVPVIPGDTADSLASRILEFEHRIYPLATRWLLEKRLALKDNKAYLDNKELGASGYDFSKTIS